MKKLSIVVVAALFLVLAGGVSFAQTNTTMPDAPKVADVAKEGVKKEKVEAKKERREARKERREAKKERKEAKKAAHKARKEAKEAKEAKKDAKAAVAEPAK
ncbi:MAG: hypothetical protein HQL15_04650 [Candidatus Omnitrophica bacterium]|nr:hypothetical protein [Candidatus Omnitrophota bacterium]